jgi:xanthine dehydrogenase accessory factor
MFDLDHLRESCAAHHRVARVVIAEVKGSAPREVGASMLVWEGGQSGTIGGGALEFEAAQRAATLLTDTQPALVTRHPLGPSLGQCCGGAVTLVTEVFTIADLSDRTSGTPFCRRVEGAEQKPLSFQRAIADARGKGLVPETRFQNGWLIEPTQTVARPLWIWGAGHVGRAMVNTLAPLPHFDITWIDTDPARYPDALPQGVTQLVAKEPARLAEHAPRDAAHLIVTYSHALDLELCHQLLLNDFHFAGLIGSKSKWARFQSRLSSLGHGAHQIARITCPIGDPSLGKHPQAIAIGVASDLLDAHQNQKPARKDRTA